MLPYLKFIYMAKKNRIKKTIVSCFSGDRGQMIFSLVDLRNRLQDMLADYGFMMPDAVRSRYNEMIKEINTHLIFLDYKFEALAEFKSDF